MGDDEIVMRHVVCISFAEDLKSEQKYESSRLRCVRHCMSVKQACLYSVTSVKIAVVWDVKHCTREKKCLEKL